MVFETLPSVGFTFLVTILVVSLLIAWIVLKILSKIALALAVFLFVFGMLYQVVFIEKNPLAGSILTVLYEIGTFIFIVLSGLIIALIKAALAKL